MESNGNLMKLNLTDKTVTFDRETVLSLLEIEEFKGSWKAYGNLAPDRLTELQRIATIESIGSSTRIEGVKLSDKEVARIMAGLSTQSFTTRDEQEVAGSAFLMNEVYDSWEEMPLTENIVKQMHSLLLRFSDKDERHRGCYKTVENNVAAFDKTGHEIGVVFETASAFETPSLMNGQTGSFSRRACRPSPSSGCSWSPFWRFIPSKMGTGDSPERSRHC